MTCRIATRRTTPAIGGSSQWRQNGVFRDLLTCLAEDLRLRGKIDLTEGARAARSRLSIHLSRLREPRS
jgi:hypothetical protein